MENYFRYYCFNSFRISFIFLLLCLKSYLIGYVFFYFVNLKKRNRLRKSYELCEKVFFADFSYLYCIKTIGGIKLCKMDLI